VSIKRADGAKVKGYPSQAGADSFTVTDSRSAQSTTTAYSDVTEVKGAGLSKGAKIGIGLGICLWYQEQVAKSVQFGEPNSK